MRDNVNKVISKYIKDPAARAVAEDLIMSLHTLEESLSVGVTSAQQKEDLLRAFVTVFLSLPANPFWQAHGGYIQPIFAIALNAWFDASSYSAAASAEVSTEESVTATVRIVSLRAARVEIALAVLYSEQGVAALRDSSVALRNDLLSAMGM